MRHGYPLLRAAIIALATLTLASAARAEDYIVVRLDSVTVNDDKDIGFAGPEGEIQYLAVTGTGTRNAEPILQRVGFPSENWYEAEDDGDNATFMSGTLQAIPIFVMREDEMGDELILTVSVVDNDDASEFVISGHAVLGTVATAVTGAFFGPAAAGLAASLASTVQAVLEDSEELDPIGTHSNRLLRVQNWGMPAGGNSTAIQGIQAGDATLSYTVMRVRTRAATNDWCASVTLNEVEIVEDGDGDPIFWRDAGEIYIRSRVADGFAGEWYHQTSTRLPSSGTKDVYAGHSYPTRDRLLWFNGCDGLPPVLYAEVGVFESDSGGVCSGRSCDDVLGVLPLTFTNAWLRTNTGSHSFTYTVKGNDPGSEKARITLTVDVWDPNEMVF